MSLFQYGERAYDHVLLFPPTSKAYGPSLTPGIILDYLKAEGNVLLALSGSSATPNQITSLLLELDIHLPSDRNALVVDHFNYDTNSASEKHDVLLVPPPKQLRSDSKNFFAGDGVIAVPRAVGQTLGNSSPLLAPILRAPSTAYSYNPKDDSEGLEDLFASGDQIALVSALQARNSARFTVLGSAEMLENTWFDAKVRNNGQNIKTVNREFAKHLTEWAFKEVGVLKVGRLFHHLNEGPGKAGSNSTAVSQSELNPKIYRIKNDVVCLGLTKLNPNLMLISTYRPTPSSSPNTPTTTSSPSKSPLTTPSNSNSPCCLPSTASHSSPSRKPQTQPSSPPPSPSQISTASSTSVSITSVRSSRPSTRSGRSPCATLRTTSIRVAGQSVARGCGLRVLRLRLLGGLRFVRYGCIVSHRGIRGMRARRHNEVRSWNMKACIEEPSLDVCC